MKNPKEEIQNFMPTKKLGQNFLINHSFVNKICDAADFSHDDIAIEVGPGYGVLTEQILEKVKYLYAIEKDRNLFSLLEKKFTGFKNIKLINGDILKTDIRKLTGKNSIKFISNLPYNITSPVLSILLENREIFFKYCNYGSKRSWGEISLRPKYQNLRFPFCYISDIF